MEIEQQENHQNAQVEQAGSPVKAEQEGLTIKEEEAAQQESQPTAMDTDKASEQGADAGTEAAAEPQPQQEPAAPVDPLVAQYTEQWAKVSDSPNDFTAWTQLISIAEKLDDVERLRAVYEPFLASYPLCYGYWKKYADAELRHQNTDAAEAVFERGVGATPYSMDLWAHYATYKKSQGGSPDDVRSIYERAVAYCGTDYVSHTLWDKYIAFEEEQGAMAAVATLYTRVLSLPLRELNRFMQGLRTFVQNRSASELMMPEEQSAFMEQLSKAKQEQAAAAAAAEGGDEPPAEPVDTSVTDDDIKAAWLSQREAMCEAAKKAADERKPFEEGIKRTYFHVKPLDTPQLTMWVRYLDHQEALSKDDPASVVLLYERCLVPCANYPEFWERYVHWLESKGMTAEADNAVQRATNVFCRTRPEIYLFAARHEERRGKPAAAREHFEHVLNKLAPDLLQAVAAAANFERRQGNIDAAKAHWSVLLEREKSAEVRQHDNGKVKEEDGHQQRPAGSKLYPFLAMQYATFLREVGNDAEGGRSVLKDALQAAPHLRQLWEAAIHLELCAGGEGMVQRVTALFESACAEPPAGTQGLNEKEREELSIRYVEFADMYADAATLLRAETAHGARFTLPTSFAAAAAAAGVETGRKRAAGSPAPEAVTAKVARADMAAHPHAAATAGLPGPPPAPAAAVPPAYGHHYPPAAPPAAAPAYQYPPAAYGHYAGYPPAAYGHYGYGY